METEPVLQPWTLETVPKRRMLVRSVGDKRMATATSIGPECVGSDIGLTSYDLLARDYTHSLDDGVSWHPCGTLAEGAQ